ncbi:MAG: hypothetical protein NC187_08700 [Candidatus Amulumruptor caecigallinarius]|nr:hypothetical protein [Candidatus Amulumruptor caecigallinarius]MCM1397547.1 hypothetical protein [Candidatus Amulumruptor caecigallinarius]MCM1454449.1 hypothetical protein [bacterium]
MSEFNDYFDDREAPHDISDNTSVSSQASAPSAANTSSTVADSPAKQPRKRHRGRKVLLWLIVIIILGGAAAVWLRYYTPYIQSQETGYVTNMERRGLIFKTYEGQMITESALTDTARVYSRDFVFSVTNDALADSLQALSGSGRKVTVAYDRYYGALPWRGAQPVIVTAILPQKTLN